MTGGPPGPDVTGHHQAADSPRGPALEAAARLVLDVTLFSPATLGPPARAGRADAARASRLVCVDGPAGSGKTTLADALLDLADAEGLSTWLVHCDDVLRGWDGLDDLGPRLHREVVQPLCTGTAGAYQRYDWHTARTAETRTVPPSDLVVLEGVGSGHPAYADLVAALVWVEAPPATRRARGLARDGEELAPHWDAFVPAEERLHARERTRARADVVVDGVSGAARPRRAPRPAP